MKNRDQDPKGRKFETTIDLAAPRDAVWQAITAAREIARWFAPTVRAEPRPGGRIEWQWGEHHTWRNTIEVFEPGQHLRLRYDSPVGDGRGAFRPLFVDFHLEGARGTTTLRLTHSGFGPEADFDQEFDGISRGWPVELRSLRLYLEQHRGQDRKLAWASRSVPQAPDAVWQRLVGDDGLRSRHLTALKEGDRFAVAVAGAGPIEGRALLVPSAREFTGVADNLGKGWLRVHCEDWGGATQVWLWLALYGQPDERVRAFQQAFEQLLDRTTAAASGGAAES